MEEQAPPAAAAPPEVRVSIPHTKVVHEAKEWRPFVVFEIHFHVGDLDHVVHKRYSQLRSLHDQIEMAGPQRYVHGHGVGAIVQMGMMQIGLGGGGQRSYPFPNFPSANIFKDYSKPEHTESRKRELIGYFNCLVHHPGVLKMPHFHKHFGFSEEAVAELIRAADHIVGPRPGGGGSLFGGGGGSLFGGLGQPQQGGGGQVIDLMSLISQAQAQASAPTPVLRTAPAPGSIVPLNTEDPVARVYDSEQLQQEYVLAQTVLERAQAFELGDDDNHHDDDHHQWLGRSPVPLIYDRKMSFNINVTNSNFGDHIVSGPGGQPWFQVVRLNRTLLSFEPAQFGIFTMRGEQLMQFVVANRSPCSCDLYHVVSPIAEDSASAAPPPQLTALCRISRGLMTINDISAHTVETLDGTVITHQATHSGSVFSLNGIPAVASDRGLMLINYFGNVVMEVEAGHDVLLFVALVVCVEKMHAKQKANEAATRRH